MTFNALLIPTDGSEAAERAARRGFDIAAQLGTTVHVLSVADSSVATSATYVGDSSRVLEGLREQAEARVTRLADDAREQGFDVELVVREGIPVG